MSKSSKPTRPNEAIILAGGLGTRLQSVVADVPKPMAPIPPQGTQGSRPFLEYLMDYWIEQGVERFVLSVCHKFEVIMRHFKNQYKGCDISYAIEDHPLGTGGALLLAAEKIENDTFWVLNGDTAFDVKPSDILDFHHQKASKWTVVLREVPLNSRYGGVELAQDGKLISFDAKGSSKKLINGGIYLVNQSVIGPSQGARISLEETILPDLIRETGSVYGYAAQGRFIDIGVPEDYERAALFFSERETVIR